MISLNSFAKFKLIHDGMLIDSINYRYECFCHWKLLFISTVNPIETKAAVNFNADRLFYNRKFNPRRLCYFIEVNNNYEQSKVILWINIYRVYHKKNTSLMCQIFLVWLGYIVQPPYYLIFFVIPKPSHLM